MKKYFFVFILIIITLTTCKKEDRIPGPDETVLEDKVRVLDEQAWKDSFISMDSSDYSLIFSNNLKNTIKAGDIIVTSSGEGLLRKATSVTNTNDGKVQIQTEPAYISEAVKQGVIELDQPLTVAMVDHIDYHYSGIKLNTDNSKGPDQAQFSWDINTVLYDYDKNLSTTADQIRLEGNLTCDWKLAARKDIGWLAGLKEVKIRF